MRVRIECFDLGLLLSNPPFVPIGIIITIIIPSLYLYEFWC